MAGFTMVATGDSIITRRVLQQTEPAFTDLVARVRSADAAFANLEIMTPRQPWVPASEYGGMYLASPPFILDELKGFGFNLFNVANNHATDYTYRGLVDTMAELRARGMVFAGGGMTLGEARSPAYLETKAGRVALIAVASTYVTGALAAEPRTDLGGRPGINPLRYHRRYVLDPRRLAALRDIDEALGTAAATRRRRAFGTPPDPHPEALSFLGGHFFAGEAPGLFTSCDPRDLQEICRWIGDARRAADYVLVSLHSHEGRAGDGNSPSIAEFIVEAAHAFVDAGADAVLGHGPHMLRPIEVYRGKPIFYSMGNFMYQSATTLRAPSEIYERLNLTPAATPADVHDARSQTPDGGPRGFTADERFWESVMPWCRFEDGALREVRLHPVSLERQRPRTERGGPWLADATHGRAILARLADLCAPFGTKIRVAADGPYTTGSLVLE